MREPQQSIDDASSWFSVYCRSAEREESDGAFTKAQPGRDISLGEMRSLKETGLVFLAKCAICILLVLLALQWRGDHAPNPRKSVAARAVAAQDAGGFVQSVIDGAASLVRAGGDALAVAARDKCLAAPRDCLSAAQCAQSAAGRAH